MEPPHIVRIYRFGAFAVDARTGELTHAGRRTPLRDQPVQLLLALLERPGELVTREELTRRLWPADTFVDFDRGLNKAINHLRDALGDAADHPQFIETLPRKGYRFIAPVTLDAADGEPAADGVPPARSRRGAWLAAAALLAAIGIAIAGSARGIRSWIGGRSASPHIASLAVIPLENLSGDPEQEYFADGMTDALITDLAKIGSLRITSRTSVMRYKAGKRSIKDIGRELDVDAVVEGTVTRAGSRVRITAQLIQVATDMHLWAETYERDVSEVLDLQRAVATDIARRIDAVVRPLDRPRRVQPEAYGLYLKGRYAFYQYTSQGWQRAIDHFNRAIEQDPAFASAYAGLADTYLVAGAYDAIPADEALTRGKAAAAKALELDDGLAGAHYALATAHTWYDWDWPAAEREFQRALELNPNDALGRNWHGGFLSLRRRHDDAIAEHERARDLDPQSLIVNTNLARAYYWARRYDDAIAQARRTLELDPRFGLAMFWLDGSLRHAGRWQEAVALRQRANPPERAQVIARTFERDGFPALMRECGAAYRKNGSPMVAARCYAQSGDTEEALEQLEICARRRCSSLVNAMVEPDFDVLREDPRFQQVLRQVDPGGPRVLDASGPIGTFIADVDPREGARPADRQLAQWAFAAWQRAAGTALPLTSMPEAGARVRLYWAGPQSGLYGEMRALRVNGQAGAAVYIRPDTSSLGPDIHARATSDPLFRDTVVYLTCVHELGHAFGLEHTADFRDIMYSFQHGGDFVEYFDRYRRQLKSRDDIAALSGMSEADVVKLRTLYAR